MSTEGVEKAMYEYKHGCPFLTEFGKVQHRTFPMSAHFFFGNKSV